MPFDGERSTAAATGSIEHEHVNRYLFARQFCRGRRVLDVASGESHRSAILVRFAAQVTGVELAQAAVEDALQTYPSSNLAFVRGDCLTLRVATASITYLVREETLEHDANHVRFLEKAKSVLRSGGVDRDSSLRNEGLRTSSFEARTGPVSIQSAPSTDRSSQEQTL
jgi:ubiquinone/menaquinone biosynthesis C-methylase UbiE